MVYLSRYYFEMMEYPKIPKAPKDGPLTRRYTITLPQGLFEEIEQCKEDHGVQVVNSWLRQLWRYGLEQNDEDKSA